MVIAAHSQQQRLNLTPVLVLCSEAVSHAHPAHSCAVSVWDPKSWALRAWTLSRTRSLDQLQSAASQPQRLSFQVSHHCSRLLSAARCPLPLPSLPCCPQASMYAAEQG